MEHRQTIQETESSHCPFSQTGVRSKNQGCRGKLKYQGSQGTIKINENVARFEIPSDGEDLDTDAETTTIKKTKTSKSTPKKETKSKKSSNRSNNLNPAMIAAYADMDIQPYNLGDNILEDDGYNNPMW